MIAGLRVGSWVMRTPSKRKKFRHRLACSAGRLDGRFQLAELHFPESQKDVVLAREIIEKGAFANVGGFSDVLDSGFHEPFLREEFQGGVESRSRISALRRWRRSGLDAEVRIATEECLEADI